MSNKIPKSILAPLSKYLWACSDFDCSAFETWLKHHQRADSESGCTCAYHLSAYSEVFDGLPATDFEAMRRDGAVPPIFHHGNSVNQHWLHSLNQFYAVVYREWKLHLKRTGDLVGTPAGTIRRQA